MKKLSEYLNKSVNEARQSRSGMKDNPYVCLVSTRNSDCAILLGEGLEEVMPPKIVKKVCKDLGLDYVDPSHDFDEEDLEDALPGAVIETGERRIIWYDMRDGSVDYYKL